MTIKIIKYHEDRDTLIGKMLGGGTVTLPITFVDSDGNTKMIFTADGDILTNGVMGPLP